MKSTVWRRRFSYFSTKLREIQLTTRNPQFGDGIYRISIDLHEKLLVTRNPWFGDGISRIPQRDCAKYHGQREVPSLETVFLEVLKRNVRNTFGATKSSLKTALLVSPEKDARNTFDQAKSTAWRRHFSYLERFARNRTADWFANKPSVEFLPRKVFMGKTAKTDVLEAAFLVFLIKFARDTIANWFPRKLARNPRFAQRPAESKQERKVSRQKNGESPY